MVISIVTPTLNASRFLKECIESVRRNENGRVPIEHLIVDAGSTDGTVEIAESYGLRVMKGKDRGIYDAVNKGSLASSGDLIGYLGADDMMLEGAIKNLLRRYDAQRDRWLCGGLEWITEKAGVLGSLRPPPQWVTSEMFASLGWCWIGHMATYFSRDFFQELGGFDISYAVSGDYELFSRALMQAPFGRVAEPISAYRRTGVNYSATHADVGTVECRRVAQLYAPRSAAKQAFYRWGLKSWLNATNPGWCAMKFVKKLRWPTLIPGLVVS